MRGEAILDIVKNVRKKLDGIRKPAHTGSKSRIALYAGIFFLVGAVLGVFAKWLDTLGINDGVWWQHILGMIDLGNILSLFPIWLLIALASAVYAKSPLNAALRIFLFFAGMCVAYHISSILIAGFNPMSYMMIWYGFTALSPLLAAVCWYGKGKSIPSLVIATLVLWNMMSCCFAIGFWYFDFRSIIDTLLFIGAAAILYVSPKNTAISLAGAFILSLLFRLPLG